MSLFPLELDLSLVNIERERGEGMPARMKILSVGDENFRGMTGVYLRRPT